MWLVALNGDRHTDTLMTPLIQPTDVPQALAADSAARAALVRTALSILGCAMLVAIGARIRVPLPFTPVPMTLQLLAVLIAGYLLRPLPAAASMLVYLAAGAVGLPVLAAGSIGFWGVTGGYLIGFVVAAWSVSLLRGGSSAGFARLLLAGSVGVAVVLSLGMAWTGLLFDLDSASAFMLGAQPFVPKAAVELILAATLVHLIQKRRMRQRVS